MNTTQYSESLQCALADLISPGTARLSMESRAELFLSQGASCSDRISNHASAAQAAQRRQVHVQVVISRYGKLVRTVVKTEGLYCDLH
jgi:hypothetical protein